MSEDILTEGKINEFIESVAKLRKDEQYRSVAPIDIVSFAAKRMGIGSCTQEFSARSLLGFSVASWPSEVPLNSEV